MPRDDDDGGGDDDAADDSAVNDVGIVANFHSDCHDRDHDAFLVSTASLVSSLVVSGSAAVVVEVATEAVLKGLPNRTPVSANISTFGNSGVSSRELLSLILRFLPPPPTALITELPHDVALALPPLQLVVDTKSKRKSRHARSLATATSESTAVAAAADEAAVLLLLLLLLLELELNSTVLSFSCGECNSFSVSSSSSLPAELAEIRESCLWQIFSTSIETPFSVLKVLLKRLVVGSSNESMVVIVLVVEFKES
ncbi:hypothetical protein FF38_09386 [Lucilia cuprina]|uniref:Uncharacterized protein n=1 Tax=Lucilia cuprina TaxID=7375 RepID=A0A0L0CQY3_LUCCU|nr:hypothetical protein FF38_09386 [Lucilia cuprina]